MSSEWTPKQKRTATAAGLAGLASLISCSYLVPGWEDGERVHALAFNHAAHGAANLECSECHAPKGKDKTPGLPKLSQCVDCHDEDEEDKAVVKYLAGIRARPKKSRWVLYNTNAEIRFSHAAHPKISCKECHGDVAKAKATGPWVVPRMKLCVRCHEKAAPKQRECAACHTKIRKDVAPADHRGDWKRSHGVKARHGDLDTMLSGQCGHCHKRDTCMSCHRQVQPRSHTNFFRIRGHGLEAANDRRSCAACHKQDMCVRCHQSTSPVSHRGNWGSPRNQHCTSCHVPLKSASCALCHKSTPGHATATPLPTNNAHASARDSQCRACHTQLRLRHPDQGTSCRGCHR